MIDMADVTSKLCDLCHGPDAVEVRITEARRAEFVVDLCPEHYSQIDDLRAVGRSPSGARTYRRYRKQAFEDR